MAGNNGTVWVQRMPGNDGFGVWAVLQAGSESLQRPDVVSGLAFADAVFRRRPEVASASVVQPGSQAGAGPGMITEASVAALPVSFLNGRIADLIALTDKDDRQAVPITRFQRWIEGATLKGLVHVWLTPARLDHSAASSATQLVPNPPAGDPRLVRWRRASDDGGSPPSRLAVGIDAAWLLTGESGAQVFVFEMVREMVRRPEITRVVFLSNTGAVPDALAGTPKVGGNSWAEVDAGRLPKLDILHRPFQPDAEMDYRRSRQAAQCVVITVLDFIAYDNPSYHESTDSWRDYQRLFDEKVRSADGVFAISRYIGARLERQFAHQLLSPVRSIHLGTDHLTASTDPSAAELGRTLAPLDHTRFLLVLGNDFEHKNRDFAVKVFQAMRRRGYDGSMALAGFHLDGGSSFDHELIGADDCRDHIIRVGAVSRDQKAWLLRHAEAVLYPTSSEGFGLIPFEAAALGTPTAFVRFGPLAETMPAVRACAGWEVGAFADHVFGLIAGPAAQVGEIRAAGALLTWQKCVDETLEAYRELLGDAAPWQSERLVVKQAGVIATAGQVLTSYARRAARKVRRGTLGR